MQMKEDAMLNGQLKHAGKQKYVTEAGYETKRDIYRCEDCSGCPHAAECKNTENSRTLRVSHHLNELKRKANENLCSEKGLKLRGTDNIKIEWACW